MRAIIGAALLTLSFLLVACRSDPVHYHTLTPLLGQTPRAVQSGHDLQIERVTVPPQVDRSQIVVRQGANGLVILETDWWGASLADEVQSAVANQFNTLPGPVSKTIVRIDIQRFDLVPGQYALLDARWRVRLGRSGSEVAHELTCQITLQTPSGPAVDELVAAQQRNVQKLAATLSDISRGNASRCPERS